MIIQIFLLTIFLSFFFTSSAYAQCPVCIVTVGGGMILAKKLGVDDLLASIWIAGLNTVIAIYLAGKIKTKILNNPFILAGITNSLSLVYFFATGQIVAGLNQVMGMDKILLGQVLGYLLVSLAYITDQFIRSKNGGKVLFYYQKVILPLSYLLIASLLSKLILL